MSTLTDRQRDIADLLLAGMDRAGIAQRLAMTSQTLTTHLCEMRRRLGAENDRALLARLRHMTRHPVESQLERCRERPRAWWDV
jgi:DNA-binding NarL/FixJ family response regulator